VFAGSVVAAPSSIDGFVAIELNPVFDCNFVIPALVCTILGLYCLLLVWACWKDKQDAEKVLNLTSTSNIFMYCPKLIFLKFEELWLLNKWCVSKVFLFCEI
jgi:hypothetical protein